MCKTLSAKWSQTVHDYNIYVSCHGPELVRCSRSSGLEHVASCFTFCRSMCTFWHLWKHIGWCCGTLWRCFWALCKNSLTYLLIYLLTETVLLSYLSRYFVDIVLISYLNREVLSKHHRYAPMILRLVSLSSRMTSGEDKSREVDTAVEDLRRYKAHLSEIARYELLNK